MESQQSEAGGLSLSEVVITEEMMGLTYFIGMLIALVVPILIWLWSRRRLRAKKKSLARALGDLPKGSPSIVLRSPGVYRFVSLVLGECVAITGIALLVPAFYGTFGDIDPQVTSVELPVWRILSIVVHAALSWSLSWLLFVHTAGKITIVNENGIATSSVFRKDRIVSWDEVERADFRNSRGFSSHTLFTSRGKVGFHWESACFWDFMVLAKAKIPKERIVPDSRVYFPSPPASIYTPDTGGGAAKAPIKHRPRLDRIIAILRSKRRALFLVGVCALALGLALDFAGVILEAEPVVILGTILPVIGSFLLLLSFVSASGVKMRRHPEAVDEAALGIGIYGYIGLCIISLLIMTPQVLENIEGRTTSLFIITPVVTPIMDVQGITLMSYFLFIVVMLLLSYHAITRTGLMNFVKVLRGEEAPKECCDADPFFGNPISTIFYFFLVNVFFSIVFYVIIRASGITPKIPDFGEELWMQAYALANASVWEEIVSRVLLLGIPLLAIDYLFRRERAQKLGRYIIGGRIKTGPVECGLALFSAIMFGLAHVGGWDFYKLIPSTVAGLFLAYMFMKYGLYAAIMLHFAVDFYDMPLQMLDRSYSGLIPFVFVLFGFLAFIVYAKALFRFIGHDLMRLGSKKEGVGG